MIMFLLVLITVSASLFCMLNIIDILLSWFDRYKFKLKHKEHIPEEEAQPIPVEIPKGYNVNEFRQRMAEYKKEYYDGVPLVDLPESIPKPDDFTGVEVITPDYEKFVEERMK